MSVIAMPNVDVSSEDLALGVLREDYVNGRIDLVTYENRVARVLMDEQYAIEVWAPGGLPMATKAELR